MAAEDDDPWMALARDVIARRNQMHMTQQELADRAGVHLNTIVRIEAGVPSSRRAPSWPRIEHGLGWPPGDIPRRVDMNARRAGYLIEVPEQEAAARADDAVHKALVATLPGATIEQVLKIQARAIKELRQAGILPPDDTESQDHGVSPN